MAGAIKNINVEIGADGTKFDAAMRKIDSQAKSLNGELKSVGKNLKFDPNSTVLLTQKQALLGESIKNTQERLASLKALQAQADNGEVELTAEEYRELEREIGYTERQLQRLISQQAKYADVSAVQLQNLGRKWQEQGAEMVALGGKLTNSITKPALIAGAALAAVAFAKGWARLTEIDSARAKLKALGHDASAITNISTSALASVKGTAYGMNDAMTLAATAVAAGVKEGAALTRYLTMVGDAAAASGTDLSQMGAILGKVQTTNRAYLGQLNQLATAGLPIYQWLAEECDTTTDKVRTMASTGKISSETFFNAIEKHVGGAAKVIGQESLTGAISNVNASIARIGANFLDAGGSGEGFFSQLKPLLVEFMGALEDAEGVAAEVGVQVGQTFSNIVNGVKGVIDWWDSLGEGGRTFVTTLGGIAIAAGPALTLTGNLTIGAGKLATSLGTASAAMAAKTLALGADTAATTTNTAATNAQILKDGLSNAARNLKTLSIAQSTASTTANTVGTIANSVAVGSSGAAMVGATIKTTALTVATGAKTIAVGTATVAQMAWNAAMSANPIGTVVVALGLLTAAAVGVGAAIGAAARANEPLTRTSQEQKAKLSELRDEYSRVKDAQGENSDAALAAKAAMDEEARAFESSKQTVAEFREECSKTVESHDELMASLNESTSAAESEAGSILNLANKYESLVDSTDDSAASKESLSSVAGALAEKSSALNGLLGEEANLAGVTAEQVQALAKAEADRVRAQAQSDNYAKLLQDECDITAQLTEAQSELTAVQEKNQTIYIANEGIYIDTQSGMQDLQDTVDELSGSLDENRAAQAAATEELMRLSVESSKMKAALSFVQAGYGTAEQAASQFGLTAAEVSDALQQQALIAEAQAVVAVNELTAALQDYSAENTSLIPILDAAGLSIEQVSQHMESQGYTVDDLKARIDAHKKSTVNAFDEIAVKSENTAQRAVDVLTNNIAATQGWTENLRWLYQDSGLAFDQEFLQTLQQGGAEEYGQFLADLRGSTEAGMNGIVGTTGMTAQQVIDTFTQAGQAATMAGLAEMGIFGAEADAILATTNSNASTSGTSGGTGYGSTFAEAAKGELASIGQLGTEEGTQVAQNIATGMTSGMGSITSAVDGISPIVSSSVSSIDLSSSGSQIVTTLSTGISGGTSNLTSATTAIQTAIETPLKAINLTPIGQAAIVKLGTGLTSGKASVTSAISSITTSSISQMSGMSSQSYAIGMQCSAGLANGIRANGAQVANAMSSVVSAAIARGKSEAAIASPSKKTYYMGEMMVAGAALAIDKEGHKIADSMGDAFSNALDAGENTLQIGSSVAQAPQLQMVPTFYAETARLNSASSSDVGSPFDVTQLVRVLQDSIAVGFDRAAGRWSMQFNDREVARMIKAAS